MTAVVTMSMGGLVIYLFIYLTFIALSIWATARIITKAGYSGWWVLVAFVPLVNIIMFLVFAFAKWPLEQRLEAARRSGWYGPGPNGPYGPRGGGYPPNPPSPPVGAIPAPPSAPYGASPAGVQASPLAATASPAPPAPQTPGSRQPAEPDIPPFRL